jgi:Holliday junction resolvasome RuvABC ATP-dependent DNA helicase subunit
VATMLLHLETIRKERELDEDGFGRADFEYLRILRKASRPMGLESIASNMRTTPLETIESEIEPFLLQQGAIEFTGKGRLLTANGEERLARSRDHQ